MSSTLEARTGDSRPDGIDEAEWHVRCDLAAAYQLIDLYGMSDLAGTHLSARVPGPHDHFLLNPVGVLFDQITASSLIKVDLDGKVLSDTAHRVNTAGFVIHSAIHMARPDLVCAVHTHTVANNAIAATNEGLLPLFQKTLLMLPVVGYHDFEGPVAVGERERIVSDLGEDGRVILLRNHGALTVGRTIAEAWVWMYRLEMCCRFQVAAMSCVAGGMTAIELSDDVKQQTMARGRKTLAPGGNMAVGSTEWDSLLRKLERERGMSYLT